MSCKTIITITRQFGSGGHEIGKLISEKLGIAFYDKELITLAAKESGVSPEVFEPADERMSNSLLYSYILQHKIIKEKAESESFVVVGRCADYILKDNENVVKVFIYADIEVRAKRAVERRDIEPSRARQAVFKADKNRANYYSFYSGQKWGATENYDLCLNSTKLTAEQADDIIIDYVKITAQES